jgi:hypothetical protein
MISPFRLRAPIVSIGRLVRAHRVAQQMTQRDLGPRRKSPRSSSAKWTGRDELFARHAATARGGFDRFSPDPVRRQEAIPQVRQPARSDPTLPFPKLLIPGRRIPSVAARTKSAVKGELLLFGKLHNPFRFNGVKRQKGPRRKRLGPQLRKPEVECAQGLTTDGRPQPPARPVDSVLVLTEGPRLVTVVAGVVHVAALPMLEEAAEARIRLLRSALRLGRRL